jgi:hypothetical protein
VSDESERPELRLSSAVFRAIWENTPATFGYEDTRRATIAALDAVGDILCGPSPRSR